MLYIVSTPIGNLQDISQRALDLLSSCDYILCEDTRQTQKLLNHYAISKEMVSFHLFNEKGRQERVLSDLHAGKIIALVSDAGTPLIADPGETLVKHCREQAIKVTAIPGPCALITALTLSGFSASPFQFVGFLPKKLGSFLQDLLAYEGTTVCYESPHRIKKTLQALSELAPNRNVAVARELTKRFETVLVGTPEALLKQLTEVLGEIVLVVEGQGTQDEIHFSKELLYALAQDLITQGLSAKDAVGAVSKKLRIPRNEVYASYLALKH